MGSYAYDAADELTSTTGAVTATYTYDRDGNQLTAGADSFTYDLANRTTSATVAGVTSAYTYDADGNRRIAVSGTTTTTYRWDVAGPLPLLATETSGTTVRSYQYDPQSAPLSMSVTGKGTHFLTTDWLGSVSDVTTTAGTAEYAYTYEPFGAGPDPAPLVAGAPANPLRFAGEYRDPKTGVYNLRARQYATGTGRFSSPDPVPAAVGDPAVAPYAYASDQATRLTDPTGEFPCPLGRNPDGGCRGGHEAHVAGQFAQGAGAAGRDFVLGLTAPAPVRGQQIINGAKATAADCYAGLTTTIDPIANCLRQASGLTDLIQGLTLAFHGCVYIGAYIATGGAIQLTLTLAPFGAGRAGTARIAEDVVAREVGTPAREILMPDGYPIGRAGTDPTIRELSGGLPAAQAMFTRLTEGGGRVIESNNKLTRAQLPNGGIVQFRTQMSPRSPNTVVTIDVNIPGIDIKNVKFNP